MTSESVQSRRRSRLPAGKTPASEARWRSVNEAADKLGISRAQVYNLMAASLLAFQEMPPGGRRRIHDDELDRFMGVR